MNKTHKKSGKSIAKSMGLKAVFKYDDKMLVTTFGKKNDSIVLEESIDKETGEKEAYTEKLTFETKLDDNKNLSLTPNEYKNTNIVINVTKKDEDFIGMDYLGFKPKLEQEFFGKNYNDNIHIQIAYNLLDIKKILELHVGNVIMSLATLQRNEEAKDLIGILSFEKPFDTLDEEKQEFNKSFLSKLMPYNMYFDNVFESPKKINDPNDSSKKIIDENDAKKVLRKNYNALRMLSLIRQFSVHGSKYSTILYSLDGIDGCRDLYDYSKELFEKDLSNFNKQFIENNKMNFFILAFIFNCMNDREKQKELFRKYYRFIFYRDNKNLGFNLKTIREKIIHGVYSEPEKNKDISAIRTKLNSLLDFCLLDYYQRNSGYCEDIVKKLRQSLNEEDKEKVYEEEYLRLTKDTRLHINDKCRKIVDEINFATKRKKKFASTNEYIETVSCYPFVLSMYSLSKFLDGKEVNELLTSLINKVENIESLIYSLDEIGRWDGFAEGYELFDSINIQNLKQELMLIKNISSTKRKLKKAKKKEIKVDQQLFADAINLFKKDNFVSVNDKEGIGFYSYMDRFFDENNPENKKVKNLILSSIIMNRRFLYLVKYVDPKQCYNINHNEKLLRFVLGEHDEKQMPLSQLQRYYSAIKENQSGSDKCENRKLMVDTIVNELMSISIDKLFTFGPTLTTKNMKAIEHQKQLVSLYLTTAYLIVKGMVHTNSIYFIAWSMFERDYFYKFDSIIDDRKNPQWNNVLELAKEYQYKKKYRNKNLIEHNIKEAESAVDINKNNLYIWYRNKVTHLNLCTMFVDYVSDIGKITSYYDIYNYSLQRWALSETKAHKDEQYWKKLESDLDNYHTYQRNFLKIINLPFAYNLARYKNLTIADLFNDKYPLPKEVDKEYYNEKDS